MKLNCCLSKMISKLMATGLKLSHKFNWNSNLITNNFKNKFNFKHLQINKLII